MSSFDGAYNTLIQGVSQQVVTNRADGQVSEQINMVSDLVTGVRRRTGARLRLEVLSQGVNNNLKVWKTDVGGVACECFLNANTGELILMEDGSTKEITRFQSDYLITKNIRDIRYAGVGDSLFIANTSKIPKGLKEDGDKIPYRSGGFFEVLGSSTSQRFSVTITGGGKTFTGSYTTPNGRAPEHIGYSSTGFIAERLVDALQGTQWIFPEAGKGNLKQDPPQYKDNNKASTISFTREGNIIKSKPTSEASRIFKAEMPESDIRLTVVNAPLPTGNKAKATVLTAEPNKEYKIGVQGKVYSFKTPSGEIKEHAEWLNTSKIAECLLSSIQGVDVILPPLRYDTIQNAPEPPPVIVEDPNNDFLDYYEIAIQSGRVFVKTKNGDPISITNNTGKIYIETSNSGVLEKVGQLPASLPTLADGTVLGVGATGVDLTYFKYQADDTRWVETSHPDSFIGIANMPVELYWDGDAWKLNAEPFEGRGAGDDTSNPDPEFIDWGITGLASFQGRLVILSGSWVYLSAVSSPRVFYRTTVEDLLDSDPIGIGSSSASSASFEYGLLQNKDLLLFSPEHQALIAGTNVAITPKTASILVTSTYTSDLTSQPVTLGSSVMYAIPRSSKYFGVMEMIPSDFTDSQYTSIDASEHIPTYMAGRCRFMVSSSVANIVLLGTTTDLFTVYVHEYMWSGGDKVLKSWHKWKFSTPVVTAYFSGGLINIVTVDEVSGSIIVSDLDPRDAMGSEIRSNTYFLDHYTVLDVTRDSNGVYATLPEKYAKYIQNNNLQSQVKVAHYSEDLNSVEIGAEVCPECKLIYLNKSTTAKQVVVGLPYVSIFEPSPPVAKDYKDRPIIFDKLQLIKYYVLTDKTGRFTIEVYSTDTRGEIEYGVTPLKWNSVDLNLGKLPIGGMEGSVLPCRVDALKSRVVFRSEGFNEMNILNIEYTCKAGRMRARR